MKIIIHTHKFSRIKSTNPEQHNDYCQLNFDKSRVLLKLYEGLSIVQKFFPRWIETSSEYAIYGRLATKQQEKKTRIYAIYCISLLLVEFVSADGMGIVCCLACSNISTIFLSQTVLCYPTQQFLMLQCCDINRI